VPRRRESVTVLVPARNEAANIAPIVRDLVSLLDDGLIDQVLVAEHDSTDGTAETASRLGAEVVRTAGVYPELGPVLGKGDNLWRGLTAARGDIVCFIDGDSADFGPHFVHRLFGPLRKPGIAYVKAFYRRPWRDGDVVKPTGGGRVTTLLARPLLRRFYPELAWLQQPLAGEMAARRSLLESLPFATGYGLEIGLLIDVYRRVGAAAIRQVDLHSRQNRHQPLEDLGPMSDAILESVAARLVEEGRLAGVAAERRDRPPLARMRAAA
jgi:glucosyl-3-phosphoglycerate synthase